MTTQRKLTIAKTGKFPGLVYKIRKYNFSGSKAQNGRLRAEPLQKTKSAFYYIELSSGWKCILSYSGTKKTAHLSVLFLLLLLLIPLKICPSFLLIDFAFLHELPKRPLKCSFTHLETLLNILWRTLVAKWHRTAAAFHIFI